MFGNTILHVKLPDSANVEQAMAKLKAVKAVRYSELNGRVGIQPVPQPIQIRPAPPAVQLQLVPGPAPVRVPELVAPPPRPDPVAPPVFRPGGGGPVDEAKIAQFKKSLNTWEKLKEECGGNYTYSKRWSSWVGLWAHDRSGGGKQQSSGTSLQIVPPVALVRSPRVNLLRNQKEKVG